MRISRVYCDPKSPKAGEPFRLVVELDQPANPDITIKLEKQRLVLANGGQPELRPTGVEYFSLFPKVGVLVKAGDKMGSSEPIEVRPDAKAPSGDAPVQFPEKLLLTAYSPAVHPPILSEFISVLVQVNRSDNPIR